MGKPLKITDQGRPWNRKPKARRIGVLPERRHFLIVSEGAQTEPLYFGALEKSLPPGIVRVVTCGTGRNTLSLVKEIKVIREKRETDLGARFDEVWAVFDKDSFTREDFDNAIHACTRHGYKAAWSNECFELWYLLHFQDQQTGMARDAIYRRLEGLLGVAHYSRLKGEAGRCIHGRMATHPQQSTAIRRAKKLHNEQCKGGTALPPSKSNPCTTVFLLVEALIAYRPRSCPPTGTVTGFDAQRTVRQCGRVFAATGVTANKQVAGHDRNEQLGHHTNPACRSRRAHTACTPQGVR